MRSRVVTTRSCKGCGAPTTNPAYCSHACYWGYRQEHPGEFRPSEESERRRLEKTRLKAGQISQTLISLYATPKGEQIKRRISNSLKGRFAGENSPSFGLKRSEETKRRNGEKNLGRPWPLESRERRLKAVLKGVAARPNRSELKLEALLGEWFPREWKYVGNGEVIIGRRCPDFINVNGKKSVIELFGDYWHRNDDPAIKIAEYADYGFTCLVIWERELADVDLPERVRGFTYD